MDIQEVLGSDIPRRIYAWHEQTAEDWRRPHLGASIIGRECERQIWYSFHWAKAPDFGGRMLRLFETGHLEEDRIFKELKGIGIVVHSQQTRVQILPHFLGSIDGIGEGFTESKAPHLVEVKTYNAKNWITLIDKGVEGAKPEHYAQMQVYMGGLGLERAYYLAKNKDTDELYAERIKYNPAAFESLKAKAQRIIDAPDCKKVDRVSENPAAFSCKFCEYKILCHGLDTPLRNCRTCLHSTPQPNGWHCARHNDYVPVDFQKEGCQNHLFIPGLLNRNPVNAGDNFVEYEDGFVDHEGA